jgi:DNA-binding response OmpR family regulator
MALADATSTMIRANDVLPPGRQPLPDLPDSVESEPSRLAGHAIILVVERDPNVRALETYFLKEAGFTVDFANDGVEALTRARALHPDIIISEVLVPKLDGLALCRAVKTDPDLRETVVLIFSILAVRIRAEEAGADAFLMKPLGERRLVDTVRQLLLLRARSEDGGPLS